jgi:hypothetical protein
VKPPALAVSLHYFYTNESSKNQFEKIARETAGYAVSPAIFSGRLSGLG